MTNEELWVQYKEYNSKEAKDALIIEYVELVKIIAGRLYTSYNAHVEFDDLLSYGIIGLIDALEKFDHKKNIKFETYANIRIRGAIIDQIRHMDWIPRSTRQKYKRIEEAVARLQKKFGNDFTDEQIADELGLTLEAFSKLLGEATTYSVVSLEEKIEDSLNFDIASNVVDIQPEDRFVENEMKKILSQTIEQLPEKEMRVMQLYYYSELTYKEIAEILEISESRVSQIHTKAISKLKIALNDLY
ncbi:sigma-70 family RNA polymerase sigma factor [Fusibacter tunisiensis]|uniref:RNA polymerase sigma factor n=1 Tax=Fusibacter tunisiensis TaxID=1008308 RepID=A0ABS2MMI4_9FIRM|nr:FliA/WhiG family RNA polymerase sigma factor [Fusibacter tunisiensis]MBM7560611.1 RNA polymerase sigma factor for flagellar operon FliA [Fusibacter tunisiensis]